MEKKNMGLIAALSATIGLATGIGACTNGAEVMENKLMNGGFTKEQAEATVKILADDKLRIEMYLEQNRSTETDTIKLPAECNKMLDVGVCDAHGGNSFYAKCIDNNGNVAIYTRHGPYFLPWAKVTFVPAGAEDTLKASGTLKESDRLKEDWLKDCIKYNQGKTK